MKQLQTGQQEKAEIEIRRLKPEEVLGGVELFARSVPRHWPVTSEEARTWVQREFSHSKSVVFGYFWNTRMVAVNALCQLPVVLEDIDEIERKLLKTALKQKFSVEDPEVGLMHWGGLAVEAEFEGMGIARKLGEHMVQFATGKKLKGLFAQCARPSKEYPNLRGLEIAKSLGFNELFNDILLTYPHSRLEKVWLYKTL
jgi:GNAT superfamily N-acetyltransferase